MTEEGGSLVPQAQLEAEGRINEMMGRKRRRKVVMEGYR